jgi:hypothetical protein
LTRVPPLLSREESLVAISRLKRTIEQDDRVIRIRAFQESSLESILPRVKAPTLVLHPHDVISPSGQDSADLPPE